MNPDDAAKNTDVEIWRETEGDYYSPSIFVTEQGGIGINVGGHCAVKPVCDWHALAVEPPTADMEWQPIETAPKDGTEVLLFWQYTYPNDEYLTQGVEIGAFDEGCWTTYCGDTPDSIITHWMPLPAPPQEDA